MQAAGVVTANLDGKGIVEAERRQDRKLKLLLVFLFHLVVHGGGIFERRLLEDGGEGGAGVLGVNINSARQHGLLADVGAGQIEAALHLEVSLRLNLLGNQFAEDELLRKIFGADYYHVLPGRAAAGQEGQAEDGGGESALHAGRRCFSRRPRPKSASRARIAAGTAPARMTTLFTMAKPRKMNSPSPPAPMAAAMVASPTEITVATRTPAMITLRASGSSTCHKSCRPVMPMPRPASTTARSTPMMPT